MALLAFRAVMLFLDERTGIALLDLISTATMLSYYCFAACDDPRPPKRKEKLVPTAA
jgi:hypothetical protein